MSYPVLSDPSHSSYNNLSPIMEAPGSALPDPQHPAASSFHRLTTAVFEKQPPDNMRKSNFFHFMIHLLDENQKPVEVERAAFKDFHDSYSNGQEYRNGLVYTLSCIFSDGTHKDQEMCVRLIDSSTKQLVPYEGTCKNPDFRRVLLTHELICSRCLEHRSCGNKNDTPSDPIVVDRFRLKFFVKCNQNCLKNAGNPKDSRRRFQVALYHQLNSQPIGCSEAMFVHNNSKHGRRQPPFRESFVGDGKPYITSVYPNEGWTSGGTKVCIVGMNFFEGIEVIFGTLQASAEVLSPNAIAVKAPQSPRAGEVDITLVFKGSQFCINSPGKFLYMDPDEVAFDHNFSRLERLLRGPEDPDEIPKDMLLRRAADALEAFYSVPRGQQHMPGPANHGFPTYYPRSPAIFTPLFTPQFKSPGFPLVSPNKGVFGGDMEHKVAGEDSNGRTYPSNPVSRCNSNEAIPQQQVAMDGAFVFPNIPNHDSANQMPPTSIQKPRPILPSHMATPMYPVAAMPYLHYAAHPGFPKLEPGTVHPNYLGHGGEDGVNRNNNNSAHEGNISQAMGHQPMSFVPTMVPASPSHGYVMTGPPSVSPGPIPATPTGGQTFTFGPGQMSSPSKAFRGAMGKPTPLPFSGEVNPNQHNFGIYPPMFAAMPSPQFGTTFLFPPNTPTGLIAPISLPDLTATTDSAPSTTSTTTGVPTPGSSQAEPEGPPVKKAKADGSPSV